MCLRVIAQALPAKNTKKMNDVRARTGRSDDCATVENSVIGLKKKKTIIETWKVSSYMKRNQS